jgi:bacterioferritin-associated ferredoxin
VVEPPRIGGIALAVAEDTRMYVCHCRVVNDRRIRETIDAGATTPGEVARACGAGATCGGCVPMIRRLLAERADPSCALACPMAGARPAPVMVPPAAAAGDVAHCA